MQHPTRTYLLGQSGVRDNDKCLGAKAELENGAIVEEQLEKRDEDWLANDFADVSARLRHAGGSCCAPLAPNACKA